jgi:8-oxo-dGTP pyrophosphatase MutT (NUDIX family)
MATVNDVTLDDDLLAEGEPEAEFEADVADRMPRKRVAAGALIRDPYGRILLVEPVYKPTWEIPGGVVEENESPLEACRREVCEELGIPLPVTRLLVVDWTPRQGVWHDALIFVFDGGVIDPELATRFRLPPAELAGARFTTLDAASGHLRPSSRRRLAAAVDAATTDSGPVYLHFGRPMDC